MPVPRSEQTRPDPVFEMAQKYRIGTLMYLVDVQPFPEPMVVSGYAIVDTKAVPRNDRWTR